MTVYREVLFGYISVRERYADIVTKVNAKLGVTTETKVDTSTPPLL